MYYLSLRKHVNEFLLATVFKHVNEVLLATVFDESGSLKFNNDGNEQ